MVGKKRRKKKKIEKKLMHLHTHTTHPTHHHTLPTRLQAHSFTHSSSHFTRPFPHPKVLRDRLHKTRSDRGLQAQGSSVVIEKPFSASSPILFAHSFIFLTIPFLPYSTSPIPVPSSHFLFFQPFFPASPSLFFHSFFSFFPSPPLQFILILFIFNFFPILFHLFFFSIPTSPILHPFLSFFSCQSSPSPLIHLQSPCPQFFHFSVLILPSSHPPPLPGRHPQSSGCHLQVQKRKCHNVCLGDQR